MGAAERTDPAPKKWASIEETARHLGVREETLYRCIERRRLPAYRLGQLWKFKLSEIGAWGRGGGAEDHRAPYEAGGEP